ncbi:MAG: glycosyltransferase [Rhodocyclales bacterium]|nr:glycosyltransferase [Rhodocyclales bacterium]
MGDKLQCHILFTFREGPWGGCNQFLTALREELRASGNWVESPEAADVILIDSFNDARAAIRWKRRLPAIPFVHRVDGPISTYRGGDFYVDRLIHAIGSRLAEGVVFQSQYSKDANLSLGMPHPRFSCVVNNAAHQEHFWPRRSVSGDARIRIIAVSWSSHWNKGFDVYSYLDRHLDFSRYSMTFVGNSPVPFSNIRHIPPQDLSALGELLRGSDIYVTASRHESCSNSLLEALACGLPAVAIRSGGNPEVLGPGGELFSGTDDVIACIEAVAENPEKYRAAIPVRKISDVASAYLSFFEDIHLRARPARTLTLGGATALWWALALRRGRTLRDRLMQLLKRNHFSSSIRDAGQHAPE